MKLSVHRRSSLWSTLVLLSSYVILATALPQVPSPQKAAELAQLQDKGDDATSPNAPRSKFSRLLSAKADLLKYSSISTTGEKIPFISIADIAHVVTAAPKPVAAAVLPTMTVSSSFSMSSSSSKSNANSIIPQPSTGSISDHTDLILQSYRAPLFEFNERAPSSGPKAVSTESSFIVSPSQANSTPIVTDQDPIGLLRRPVSRRGPASVLQQMSTGNKLNLTPLFEESAFESDDKDQELEEAATNNYPSYFEDTSSSNAMNSNVNLPTTTGSSSSDAEEYYDDEETTDAATNAPTTTTTTTTSTTTTVRPVVPARGRSRNRGAVLQDASTTTAQAPRFRTTTPTTTTTTTLPPPLTTTPREDAFQDNLVFVTPRRSGKDVNVASHVDDRFVFPDFEDSPAHLVTAESSQPARVNVRPASSGKEYEYEYIYYYYDDDDDENSTSTTTTPRPAAPTTTRVPSPKADAIGIKGTETFTPEKAPAKFSPPVEPSGNHLDRSRGSKAFGNEQPNYSTVDQPSFAPPAQQRQPQAFNEYSQEDYYQPAPPPAPEEYPESVRTNTRPVVLKESNLPNQEPATTFPPPTRQPTTTTTTEEPVPQAAPKSRFRTKPNFDSPPANQFVPAPVRNEDDISDSPQVEHRPVYKELTSRRIPQPQRRPEVAASPPQQVAQASPEENVRLPSRTRFPPRIPPTVPQEEVITPVQQVAQFQQQQPVRQYQQQVLAEPVLPVYYETVPQQQYEPLVTTLPPRFLDPEQEAKAKENYARQKSINDLYALTRLHQLAINTRVPNRNEFDHVPEATPQRNVPPQVAGGFINSEVVESQDNYEEPRTYLPTNAPVTTTTDVVTTTFVPEVVSEVPSRATLPIRNRGFRGRTRPTGSPSSTTEAVSRQPASPNRFTGRRRNFPQGGAAETSGTVDPVTAASPQTTPARAPGRNRFAGGRFRTTTTARPVEQEIEHVAPSVTTHAETEEAPRPQPPRRQRPGFVNRRKQAQQHQQAAPEVTEVSVATSAPSTTPGEKRRPKARPGAAGPILGRPLKSRTSTAAPEPVEPEEVFAQTEPISYVPVNPTPEGIQEQEPVVSQKVTVSSSSTVSESTPEVPKRGSSAVLGRLRNRTKPGSSPAAVPSTTSAPTTPAPTSPVTERKPSRLNGILNRRKNTPPAAEPTNVVTQTVVNEEHPEHATEDIVTPKGGVIVAVSSVVSESQEVADHEEDAPATPSSILNRLKSQRKPGSIFRKRTEAQ